MYKESKAKNHGGRNCKLLTTRKAPSTVVSDFVPMQLKILSRAVVFHPANPVAEPLPSTMRDEDLVARLPIAASLPAGIPVSKYFRNIHEEDFMLNFLESSIQSRGDNDPAFITIADECNAVSVDELIVRRRKLAMADEANFGGVECRDEDAQGFSISDDPGDFEDLASETVDGLPTPSQSQESEEERQAREQEERLAALGVTGFAKPVQTSIRRSIVLATSTSSEHQALPSACSSNLDQSPRFVSLSTLPNYWANCLAVTRPTNNGRIPSTMRT
jgi:hypothetical protein